MTGQHAINVRLDGVDDIGPAAIVERHLQQKTLVVCRRTLGPLDDGVDVAGQARSPSEDTDPNPLARQPVKVAGDIGSHQTHKIRNLLDRPTPVLGREAEYGQTFDAEVGRGLDGALEGLDPFAVTQGARKATGLRPSPIAVHNQRDMPGARIRAGQTGGVGRHPISNLSEARAGLKPA